MATVRGNPVAWENFYKTARWRRLRKFQLMQHPLCKFCLQRGIVTRAQKPGRLPRGCHILWSGRVGRKISRDQQSRGVPDVAFEHDFHEIALELHRARALDEAIVERATTPDELLH